MDADRIKLLHDGDPVHELQAKYAESKLRITDLETQLAESRERERKDLGGNREGGEVMDEKACCAHLHVKYNPVELKPGSFIDRWTCSECEMVFVPGPALTAVSSELAAAKQRITELETQLAETERRKEGLWDCADYAAQCLKDMERQLAESREWERRAIDLLNQIACRCTSELQDRSGQHVARVPGSRQWRDALYSIRLQIESMPPSQASAEGKK